MKEFYIYLIALCAIVGITGCTNTRTHYDANGNITMVEEVTNFSRAMDGTNNKSQIVLVNGTWIDFEASATAGENCTPGIHTRYADGKTAFINAKDGSRFTGVGGVLEKFFTPVSISADGVEKK